LEKKNSLIKRGKGVLWGKPEKKGPGRGGSPQIYDKIKKRKRRPRGEERTKSDARKKPIINNGKTY